MVSQRYRSSHLFLRSATSVHTLCEVFTDQTMSSRRFTLAFVLLFVLIAFRVLPRIMGARMRPPTVGATQDEVAGARAPASETSPADDPWEVSTENTGDDSSTVTILSVRADADRGERDMNNSPRLVVRCRAQETDLYFIPRSSGLMRQSPPETVSVTLRLDANSPQRETWRRSDYENGLAVADTPQLLRALMMADTLRVSYSLSDARPTDATFSVAGLRSELANASNSCGSRSR
jgi:hypothetical protein